MNSSENTPHYTLLGSIEPHMQLLRIPSEYQLLYKIMKVEDLLSSLTGNYLYFNRVDSYSDFPNADENDGRQLPTDQPFNAAVRFQKAPNFSAADYYDKSRRRTYACCFSVGNSNYIWETYANGSEKGKVCVVFEFGKLRAMLNSVLNPESANLIYEGNHCPQIFSVNYGLVNYVAWGKHRTNKEYLSNPILYTYFKDIKRFSEEKELRISLSAFGIGNFSLNHGTLMEFPSSLRLDFDFRNAIASSTIREILLAPEADTDILMREFSKLRIMGAKRTVSPIT